MPAPKYIGILDELRSRCSAGTPGTKLTPERQLAKEFSVSTMTIRQSLAKLAEEGWIERRPGSGTYVSRPMVVMGPTLTSFTEDMRRLGLTPSAKVLRFERVSPGWEEISQLQLRPGEDAILLERLRFADGEPMCHEVAMFPGRFAQVFSDARLEGSIHEVLIASDIVPYSTSRLVRAVVVPTAECELLNLPASSPGLEIVDVFTDARKTPIQFVRSRYRFDRYEVLSRIERLPRAPTSRTD